MMWTHRVSAMAMRKPFTRVLAKNRNQSDGQRQQQNQQGEAGHGDIQSGVLGSPGDIGVS